ncbi:hypothetical protein BH23CHL2_BH23CHL2_32400 [soil metagenome]
MVACSGGADSMALLATASVALRAHRVPPFIVAHVDHATRPETRDEGRLVASAAAAFCRPFVQIRLQSDMVPRAQSAGPEADLRERRYEALSRTASRIGLVTVVTAHTKGDQVETILLRLLSGASSLASSGMKAVQEIEMGVGGLEIRRPLLDVPGPDVHQVLEILNLPHRDDPSNENLDFRRNRLRHRVIPELERLDPGFGEGLVRTMQHAAEDAMVVEQFAGVAYEQHVRRDGELMRINRPFLIESEFAISSRVVRDAIRSLSPADNREVTRERILAVVHAATGHSGARIEIPYGIVAVVERYHVVIRRDEERGER